MQLQWERTAQGKSRLNEEVRHKYEELMFKLIEGKPNKEQTRKIQEEMQKLMFGMLWEDTASEKLRANQQQKQKFEELMLKAGEGKEQARKSEEEIRRIGGDQELLGAIKAWNAQTRNTAEADKARSQKFMEAQRRIQRGLQFANQLPPEADAHYVGKGVSLRRCQQANLWYRPQNAKKYRVIYADLSVRDAATPPNVPNARPVPGQPKP